jgi:hypothetical protein
MIQSPIDSGRSGRGQRWLLEGHSQKENIYTPHIHKNIYYYYLFFLRKKKINKINSQESKNKKEVDRVGRPREREKKK